MAGMITGKIPLLSIHVLYGVQGEGQAAGLGRETLMKLHEVAHFLKTISSPYTMM